MSNFFAILMVDGWCISCKVGLRWKSLDFSDDKSTLVQVMTWCCQATSHYLSQCWPRSLSPYGVIRPKWVNFTIFDIVKTLAICWISESYLTGVTTALLWETWQIWQWFSGSILFFMKMIIFSRREINKHSFNNTSDIHPLVMKILLCSCLIAAAEN